MRFASMWRPKGSLPAMQGRQRQHARQCVAKELEGTDAQGQRCQKNTHMFHSHRCVEHGTVQSYRSVFQPYAVQDVISASYIQSRSTVGR
jgi:hypothetical protein